jgi:voltage-gated potassium channel
MLNTMESLNSEYSEIFDAIEGISVLVFTVEYILRLSVADDAVAWMVQPIALVDLLSVLPFWLDLFLPGDVFPAVQFLRMLRLFKFLATSNRGRFACKAFSDSFEENKSLLAASCFAGGAVWLVTASLMFLAETNNKEMVRVRYKCLLALMHLCLLSACIGQFRR